MNARQRTELLTAVGSFRDAFKRFARGARLAADLTIGWQRGQKPDPGELNRARQAFESSVSQFEQGPAFVDELDRFIRTLPVDVTPQPSPPGNTFAAVDMALTGIRVAVVGASDLLAILEQGHRLSPEQFAEKQKLLLKAVDLIDEAMTRVKQLAQTAGSTTDESVN